MTNYELMWAWLEDADDRLGEAQVCFEQKRFHRAVRLSQESSELAVKALLAFCGVDVPKEHHLDKLVARQPLVRRLAPDVQRRLYRSVRALAKERIPSFYGGSDGTPPQALYDVERAQEALEQAHFVLETIEALIEAAEGQTGRPEE